MTPHFIESCGQRRHISCGPCRALNALYEYAETEPHTASMKKGRKRKEERGAGRFTYTHRDRCCIWLDSPSSRLIWWNVRFPFSLLGFSRWHFFLFGTASNFRRKSFHCSLVVCSLMICLGPCFVGILVGYVEFVCFVAFSGWGYEVDWDYDMDVLLAVSLTTTYVMRFFIFSVANQVKS